MKHSYDLTGDGLTEKHMNITLFVKDIDTGGGVWAIHAGGNGNFNDHFVRFEKLNE